MSCHKMSSCPANVCRLFHGCLTALEMSVRTLCPLGGNVLSALRQDMCANVTVNLLLLNGDTQPGIVCMDFLSADTKSADRWDK